MIRSEICGAVKMKVYLTGMPELRLGLNDKILFENTGSKECWGVTSYIMYCVLQYCIMLNLLLVHYWNIKTVPWDDFIQRVAWSHILMFISCVAFVKCFTSIYTFFKLHVCL